MGFIESYGYTVKWKILNSKVHGAVPQNRARFYLVAIKKDSLRKKFRFPRAIDAMRLSDVLLPALPVKMRASDYGSICKAKPLKLCPRVATNISMGLSQLAVQPSIDNPCVIDGACELKVHACNGECVACNYSHQGHARWTLCLPLATLDALVGDVPVAGLWLE